MQDGMAEQMPPRSPGDRKKSRSEECGVGVGGEAGV
jgi:hypothetical protein